MDGGSGSVNGNDGIGGPSALDHIRPLSADGCDVPENIVICHRDTNEEKADSFPHWKTNGKRFRAERVKGRRTAYTVVSID